jgi:signal transduction histidine kinase
MNRPDIALIALLALPALLVAYRLKDKVKRQATAIDHLRSVDEMKNSILRAVSHELRTPLTFIKGTASLLEEEGSGGMPAEMQQSLYARLVANCDRLEEMLTSLLDLERLSRGVIEPDRKETDILALLRRMADAVNPERHSIEVDGGSLVARVDPRLVERIAENLFANAVRHTPPGTKVTALAERSEEGVLITVEDTGRGLPEHLRETIFQPFVQTDESIRTGRGTGIGLSLVAKFAEVHGGRAWVEDGAQGGARFRVLLGDPGTELDAARAA